ncbi:hypothetical protein WN944_026080 [Citrus x changshan-huyou]|uniref:Uncharacterized protein n=1 Tax=Citrus x changshan-huyou TaxID=2935761 RepID=A0AAP0QHA3_9ROSI
MVLYLRFKFVDVLLNWGCAEVLLSITIVIEKYHGSGVSLFLSRGEVRKRNYGRWPLGIMPQKYAMLD